MAYVKLVTLAANFDPGAIKLATLFTCKIQTKGFNHNLFRNPRTLPPEMSEKKKTHLLLNWHCMS